LGAARGVRRIRVRNPDGGQSRVGQGHVSRLGDTIICNCVAHRILGPTPGDGTSRTAAEIEALFVEGGPNSISLPWAQARIAFRLQGPVRTITLANPMMANLWPEQKKPDGSQDGPAQRKQDFALFDDHGGVPGALNIFFFRDVEDSTAYSWTGQASIIVIGDEPNQILGPVDFQQVVAHEVGHSICLPHTCLKPGEDSATTNSLLGRPCVTSDSDNLMYPFWDVSDSMLLVSEQIDQARIGATFVEIGKTTLGTPQENKNHCLSEDGGN
jgi:hypothetical protein